MTDWIPLVVAGGVSVGSLNVAFMAWLVKSIHGVDKRLAVVEDRVK